MSTMSTTTEASSVTFLRSKLTASSTMSSVTIPNVVAMPHTKLSQHRSLTGRAALDIDADRPPPAEQDDPTEHLFFDLYESPCLVKASNDAFSYQEKEEFLTMCNETFFGGCQYETLGDMVQDVQSEAVVEWMIVFDYEIYYTQDPIPAVDHLESMLLEHLSEVTGLNGCDDDGQDDTSDIAFNRVDDAHHHNGTTTATAMGRGSDYGYRQRKAQTKDYIHDFSDKEMERMVAISSDPTDQLDPDHMNCIVPVASSVASNADCMPVAGAIHLYLNNTDDGFLDDNNTRLSIESGFQRLVRFGMQQGLYVSGNVKHVSFIGTRIFVNDGSDSGVNNVQRGGNHPADSTNIVKGDHRAGIIIGVVGGIVLTILLIALLKIRRSRNASRANANGHEGGDETAMSSLPVGGMDEENPYLMTKTPLAVTERVPRTANLQMLPSTRTAGTMDMDMEDEDEDATQVGTQNDSGGNEMTNETGVLGDENLTTTSVEELKVFHDDEEEEVQTTAALNDNNSNDDVQNEDKTTTATDSRSSEPNMTPDEKSEDKSD